MNSPPTGNNNSAGHSFGIPVNAANMNPPGGPVNVQRSLNSQQAQQIQQQQQQRQRMLLQQRALQQQKHQQALQNYESQFYQLLMTLNKKPKRIYNFVEDTDLTLKKYEQYRPSFEFHIYENNYKICAPANTRLQQQQKAPELTSDGLILNKNNAILKEFLEYVARGKIPESIMEVLRDCNIQFYEGNLILQVYDHTNTVDVAPKEQKDQSAKSLDQNSSLSSAGFSSQQKPTDTSSPAQQQEGDMKGDPASPSTSKGSKKMGSATFKRPRVYRTLLKPNDLTHYYDMMSYADHTRFSDSIYQQLESEILSLTKRNLTLDVPLNPFEHKDKLEKELFAVPHWDQSAKSVVHTHRSQSKKPGTKGAVGHIEEHEELPQHSSNYEQLMLIMSERTTTSTNSTFAASLAKNAGQMGTTNMLKSGSVRNAASSSVSGATGNRSNSTNSNQVAIAAAAAAAAAGLTVGNENNQFSRLKFIEQWRVNKEKRKQQALNNNIAPNSFNTRISMATPLTPQQQQQASDQPPENQDDETEQQQQHKNNSKRSNADKPKQKRPRKTKKATPNEGEVLTKKRRTTKKKQAENVTPAGASETY